MAGCVALLLLFAARVDINEFSLNAFYRSRLVRCYLGATKTPGTRHPQHFTNFDDADDVLLSELSKDEIPKPVSDPEAKDLNCRRRTTNPVRPVPHRELRIESRRLERLDGAYTS